MRLAALSCVMLSVIASGSADAQISAVAAASATADSAISSSHIAAARTLLGVIRFEEAAVSAAMETFDQQIAAKPGTEIFRDLVEEWLREVFAGEDAQLAFAGIYAGALSEDELVELTAFYRSPLGVRLAAMQPELMAEGAAAGQRLASAHQSVLEKRMLARVAELEAAAAIELE